MRFKITTSKWTQRAAASWPRSSGERFLVAGYGEEPKDSQNSKIPKDPSASFATDPRADAQGVQWNSHLGVVALEARSPSGVLVERMIRVRQSACTWNQETGETVVVAELVTSHSGTLKASIGYDLPENGQAEARAREKAKRQVIRAQMTGKVLQVLVEPGTLVTPDTPLVVIEAMKMENRVFAARAGKVSAVAVKAGDLIQSGRELLVIEAT